MLLPRVAAPWLLLLVCGCSGNYLNLTPGERAQCPGLVSQVYVGYAPAPSSSGATYRDQPYLTRMEQCALSCCHSPSCNVAVVFNSTSCVHVRCTRSQSCLPRYRPDLALAPRMVLVRPAEEYERWTDFLDGGNETSRNARVDTPHRETRCSRSEDCGLNESCFTRRKDFYGGACECNSRFDRDAAGVCRYTIRSIRDLFTPNGYGVR